MQSSPSLPFATGSFDACICKGALDHFDRPEEAIAEMARVTALDGQVVLAIANFDSLSCRVGRAVDDFRQDILGMPVIRDPRAPNFSCWIPSAMRTLRGFLLNRLLKKAI